MTIENIPFQRLQAQRLDGQRCTSPQEVVNWLGAVQAQEFAGAKWSLAMRMQQPVETAISQAYDRGEILRTHVLRPTWHFVSPVDIRWMQELSAPRVIAAGASMYRRYALDGPLLKRSLDVIARALEGGRALTRVELGKELDDAGIRAVGLRLIFIVHRAEMEALVCSGPLRGKQFTYMLLDERAPQDGRLTHDEAVAELTRRYFASRSPATAYDFSWWSGMTVGEARKAIEMLGSQLTHEEIDGLVYWRTISTPPMEDTSRKAYLLPTYDEFIIGYAGFDKVRQSNRVFESDDRFASTIMLGGKVIGRWRRSLQKTTVALQLVPFEPLSEEDKEAVLAAAHRYAEFLGLELEPPVWLKAS